MKLIEDIICRVLHHERWIRMQVILPWWMYLRGDRCYWTCLECGKLWKLSNGRVRRVD